MAMTPKGRCAVAATTPIGCGRKHGRGKFWEGLDPQELYTGPILRAAGRDRLGRRR